jgi:hypothetical protein
MRQLVGPSFLFLLPLALTPNADAAQRYAETVFVTAFDNTSGAYSGKIPKPMSDGPL